MLFMQVIAICSEDHMKDINNLRGQNIKVFNVNCLPNSLELRPS
jgi:hypothetical protein